MQCFLLILLALNVSVSSAYCANGSVSTVEPALVLHGLLPVEEPQPCRITTHKEGLKQKVLRAVKKIPHPNMDQMNKFNTVTGFTMQVVQIIVSLKTGGKVVKLF